MTASFSLLQYIPALNCSESLEGIFLELKGVDPHWFRRTNHALGSLIVVFYLIREDLGFSVRREMLAIIFLLIPLTIEVQRRYRKTLFLGLREHEKNRLASYVWFDIAAVLLILLFPQQIAAPLIITVAFADPVIGELKRFGFWYSKAGGFLTTFIIFLIFRYNPLLGGLGAVLAVIGEHPNHRFIDDDFLMPMLPAVVLGGLYLYNPGLFPDELLEVLL